MYVDKCSYLHNMLLLLVAGWLVAAAAALPFLLLYCHLLYYTFHPPPFQLFSPPQMFAYKIRNKFLCTHTENIWRANCCTCLHSRATHKMSLTLPFLQPASQPPTHIFAFGCDVDLLRSTSSSAAMVVVIWVNTYLDGSAFLARSSPGRREVAER